jgi:putative toxin-antitoxin system antitoxin component (TIGR02293 family)
MMMVKKWRERDEEGIGNRTNGRKFGTNDDDMGKKKKPAGTEKSTVKKAPQTYEAPESEPNTLEEPLALYASPPRGVLAVLKFLGGVPSQYGLSVSKGIHDFIALIRKGISRQSLDHLMQLTGITTDEMAAIMHTSERTLRRYTATTVLNPEQSERAFELARLYSRGEEVFGSLELFKDWMSNTVLALGNKKPKEFLDTSLGIDVLMDELGRIEHGIFA